MKAFAVLLMLVVSASAVAQTWNPPTSVTLPKRWLRTVPLGTARADVAAVMGLPAKQMELGGQTLWQYERRSESGGFEMVENYTFVFEGDKLVDVRYVNGRNRQSAVEVQSAK
jgi:hypothetical protein